MDAPAPGQRTTDLNARAASDGDPAEDAAGAVRIALLPTTAPPASSSPGTEPLCRGRRLPGRGTVSYWGSSRMP
jgi:hypothetical protein